MSVINATLRFVFDLCLGPFRSMPALVSLTLVSLLVSILMLVVFKKTSNQTQLAAVKRRIHAGLFEIRLFSDDLRAILRAQNEILRTNLTYLRLSFVPMLWIIVPVFLVIAQLQFHYGYSGLVPGQRALVTADLKDDATMRPRATLDAPPGLRVETPMLFIPSQKEIAWRILAERSGDYDLTLRVGDGAPLTKSVRVAQGVVRRSPSRVDANVWRQLLYPAESPLPSSSSVRSIHVTYPEAKVNVFGFSLQWMIPFFALSVVFAFALRGLFKVTI